MSEALTKTIYIVRHGESKGNIEGFSQLPDTPLTEKGHTQALRVAERCQSLEIDMVVASNFLRAQETAEHIGQILGMSIVTNEHFHERMAPFSVRGKHKNSEEYLDYIKTLRENYVKDANWAMSGMETHNDLLERADKAIDFLLTAEASNILVVSHGMFIKYLVGRMIFKNLFTPEICNMFITSLHPDNTGISICRYVDNQWRLVSWNDRAHFAE